jgi:uncharacterized protein
MPTRSRAKSPPERRPLLILAQSGRALAAAARRAREPAQVIDGYADLDTARLALGCRRLAFGPEGFDRQALLAAVEAWRARASGIVYGAGFEQCPALLAELGALLPIVGNAPELVARLKDPLRFARLLDRLGLPHPETRLAPRRGEGWLEKRSGASGGGHVRAAASGAPTAGLYYQRRAPGRPVSVLFLADGRRARLVGFSEQWVDSTAEAPYRYGGCAGPLRLPRALAALLGEACAALVAATGLRGLNSLDLLLDGRSFQLLEVNPRPGATLDLFDGASGLLLWRLHREAVAGRLPAERRLALAPRAAAILYAPARLEVPKPFPWPAWSADRGRPGSIVGRNQPICTVRATAASLGEARDLALRRATRLLSRIAPVIIA